MTEYALLISGKKIEFRAYDSRPEDIPHKGVSWLPVVREYGDPFEGVRNNFYVICVSDPAKLPPTVPDRVSPRQARLALLAINKLDKANEIISQAGEETKIAWEFSNYVMRNDRDVISLAGAIGIDLDGLDRLFIEASNL